MFLALRDIRFAKGRFALIVAVIALLTFMVVMLSALTGGLSAQAVSAVTRLPGRSLVMQSAPDGGTPTLDRSALPPSAVAALTADGDGARLGVATTRITAGPHTLALTVFGADPALAPAGGVPASGIVLDRDTAAKLGVGVGDRVTLGERSLRVDALAATGSFAHIPVGYTSVATWSDLAHGQRLSAVVRRDGAGPAVPGTTALAMSGATAAVPGYGSEHGSLLAMQGLLLAISALVVGAFFAVWTVQRLRQLAIVRAMGASRGYLLRDSLGQAGLVLLAGEGVGAALGVGLAAAAAVVVPISVTVGAVALPVAAMAVLGGAGALLAVRQVTTVDPLVALQR